MPQETSWCQTGAMTEFVTTVVQEPTWEMSSLESAHAYWVDGVLFASFAMTESEELAKKEMQNEMYLDKIIFAKYEKYTKTAKSSTNLEIGIL